MTKEQLDYILLAMRDDLEVMEEDRDEIARLVLLGIWAEEHGIPALDKVYTESKDGTRRGCHILMGDWAKDAMAALPEKK